MQKSYKICVYICCVLVGVGVNSATDGTPYQFGITIAAGAFSIMMGAGISFLIDAVTQKK